MKEDPGTNMMSRAGPYALLAALLALTACADAGRDDITRDTPPGTVPVPGAASPAASPPDPHRPDAPAADAAYPGTIGPGPAPIDTILPGAP
jgi:hypothetical protein